MPYPEISTHFLRSGQCWPGFRLEPVDGAVSFIREDCQLITVERERERLWSFTAMAAAIFSVIVFSIWLLIKTSSASSLSGLQILQAERQVNSLLRSLFRLLLWRNRFWFYFWKCSLLLNFFIFIFNVSVHFCFTLLQLNLVQIDLTSHIVRVYLTLKVIFLTIPRFN